MIKSVVRSRDSRQLSFNENVAKVRSTSVSDDGWVLKNFPAAFRGK